MNCKISPPIETFNLREPRAGGILIIDHCGASRDDAARSNAERNPGRQDAMKDLLHLAIELAESAGKITLKHFRTRLRVESKADSSPVTVADREAEEFIRREIERRFPDDSILGEEFGEKRGRSGRRWILDPIDGTKTFIRGVPMYGTMIAVEEEGRAVIGVVNFPPNKETISALRGHGCFLNGQRCQVSSIAGLPDSTVLTTAFDGLAGRWGEAALMRLLRGTAIQRTWGDCYGYYLVATGRAEIMIDPKLALWDVAPLLPIIEEAGGRLTDAIGRNDLGIDHGVASNGLVHESLLQLLRGKAG